MKGFLRVVGGLALAFVLIAGAGALYVGLRVPNPLWRTSSLISAMGDANRAPRERWYAAVALKGSEAKRRALPALITSDSSLLQDLVPSFLLEGGPDAIPVLLESLKSADPEARRAAAYWLGAMARACGPTLEDGVAMESRPGKGAAMGSGGDCSHWDAVRPDLARDAAGPLTDALQDADAGVRDEARKALADVAAPAASSIPEKSGAAAAAKRVK